MIRISHQAFKSPPAKYGLKTLYHYAIIILHFEICLKKLVSGNTRLGTNRSQCRCFNLRMIRHSQGYLSTIGILAHHRNMFLFSNNSKPQRLERLNDFPLGRIYWKFAHHFYTPASATKASSTGGSTSSTSLPKLSI